MTRIVKRIAGQSSKSGGIGMARTLVLALCAGAPVVIGAAPALAQVNSREGIELQNQIMELRQQLSQLQSAGAASGASSGSLPPPTPLGAASAGNSGDLVAQLVDRVNTLEDQQRDMRGQIEQLTNQLKEQNDALTKQIGDLSFAMQNGKGGGVPAPASAPAVEASSGGGDSDAPHAQTPDAYLKTGNAALLKRDYAGAQQSAESALKTAKGGTKVDAQFLLGQSLAGQKQYRDSAVSYYDAYKLSPKGARAPDALLGVSASLIALGDKKAACQALGKLKAEFPSPVARVSHASQIFTQRAGCS